MAKAWNNYLYFRDLTCACYDLPLDIVWLNDIKSDPTRAEQLAGRNVYIVSNDGAPCYWKPNKSGYSGCIRKAGVYKFEEAYEATNHCGPEKRVGYSPAPMLTEIEALDQIAHVLGTRPVGSIEGWGQIQAIILQYHNQTCPTLQLTAALDDFSQAMKNTVIPEICEAVRERIKLAAEARGRFLGKEDSDVSADS